jgi:hypothetical protein
VLLQRTTLRHVNTEPRFPVISITSTIHAFPAGGDKLHSYIKQNSSIDTFSLLSEIIPNVIKCSHFKPYFPKERESDCDQILRLSWSRCTKIKKLNINLALAPSGTTVVYRWQTLYAKRNIRFQCTSRYSCLHLLQFFGRIQWWFLYIRYDRFLPYPSIGKKGKAIPVGGRGGP